jgi:hypothetical protein
MKNLGNLNKLMKQAQKMQTDMARVQEELAEVRVSGTSGGGAVTVTMDGKQEMLELSIDPKAVDPEDVEMLEDLILAAYREARARSEEVAQTAMSKVTGGLGGMPGLF